jgi:branched-chain amino acid transport system permease protein
LSGLTINMRPLRYVPWALIAAAAVFAVLWVVALADNSAFDDSSQFVRAVLDSVTLAGLLFVVGSGFTLIFGLMRVVNMAHGSFFLLGGYIALELQRNFVGGEGGLSSSNVSLGMDWLVPLLVGAAVVSACGLVTQQALLRWNQGQDLRQALITIAISIILADQMVAHFGGVAKDIAWPKELDGFANLHISGVFYSWTRLFILAVAAGIGILLYLWLYRTRTGMIIRAGVDDRAMVSALGINIQWTFAIAFVVGSALAGIGGVMGGSFASLAPGVDANWLLNSLVVVIIGGMGSLGGAVVGSLLYGAVTTFSSLYLPSNYTYYSIIFTFVLLTAVLAVRPHGLFGRPA